MVPEFLALKEHQGEQTHTGTHRHTQKRRTSRNTHRHTHIHTQHRYTRTQAQTHTHTHVQAQTAPTPTPYFHRTIFLCSFFDQCLGPGSTSHLPPAASTLALALSLKAPALITSALLSSPVPRIWGGGKGRGGARGGGGGQGGARVQRRQGGQVLGVGGSGLSLAPHTQDQKEEGAGDVGGRGRA